MVMKEFKSEIERLWTGSGYNPNSLKRFLVDRQTRGFTLSLDGTAGLFYFNDFKVFFSLNGYEIL